MPPPVNKNLQIAEWDISGPMGLSREDVRFGQGPLRTDYGTNVDTRWDQELVLGPQVTVVDLGAVGGTAANANGFARAHSLYANAEIAIVTRGTDPAAVRLSDFAVGDPGLALAERALGVFYSKNSAGTQELSFPMAGTAYHVITALAGTWPTVTPTASANNEGIVNRVIFDAWPSNVVMGLGGQVVRHNELTGAVGMDASAWATRATITGEAFTFTSGARRGAFIVIGGTNGPYAVDNDFQEYRALLDAIGQETTNCWGMAAIDILNGIVCPTKRALWLIKENSIQAIGLEKYTTNTSPIRGRVTALCQLEPPWFLVGYLDDITTDTHYLFGRPSTSDDPWEHPVVLYPGWTLTDTDSEFVTDIGTASGTRDNPTIVFGHEDDIAYVTQGRIQREIADSNYRFAASGTWYGTELRRQGHLKKRVRWVELETDDCTSDYKVQVSLSLDGRTAHTVTPAYNSDAVHRREIDPAINAEARRIKPQIALTGTSGGTASPKVVGRLRIAYDLVEDEHARGGL